MKNRNWLSRCCVESGARDTPLRPLFGGSGLGEIVRLQTSVGDSLGVEHRLTPCAGQGRVHRSAEGAGRGIREQPVHDKTALIRTGPRSERKPWCLRSPSPRLAASSDSACWRCSTGRIRRDVRRQVGSSSPLWQHAGSGAAEGSWGQSPGISRSAYFCKHLPREDSL